LRPGRASRPPAAIGGSPARVHAARPAFDAAAPAGAAARSPSLRQRGSRARRAVRLL
jgi:hypothetical protein